MGRVGMGWDGIKLHRITLAPGTRTFRWIASPATALHPGGPIMRWTSRN